ncbi:hypothetical protein [Candidatus Methylobacter oryzae]|uniref:hypothetical protein n=1 Tax=Candidatus Methylobacter oryzae TaxID=2497749 RepID=UPI00117D2A05|nr:hypothetical protein [Candidatus Methylobacter oryzae]
MPQDCLEQSRLTAKDGGNAARLLGAIAATTSLWLSNAGAVAEAARIFTRLTSYPCQSVKIRGIHVLFLLPLIKV